MGGIARETTTLREALTDTVSAQLDGLAGRFETRALAWFRKHGVTEVERWIVAGNERVIRPRFSDAEFFWNQDRSALVAIDDVFMRISAVEPY